MRSFIAIGLGVGLIAIVGGLMNIYPQWQWLSWVLVCLGCLIFFGCLILEIWEQIKSCRLKAFNSFLDKNILEGQELMASNLESFCSSWDGKDNPIDNDIKDFEVHYKKWRRQVYVGCKEALGNKRGIPFNKGKIPKLSRMRWRRNNDYRTSLKEDIQNLKDYRILTRKEDIYKKLK